MTGLKELEHRVVELDDETVRYEGWESPQAEVMRFISVLQQVVQPSSPADLARTCLVAASEADAVQRGCRLLSHLAEADSSIVDGPLRPGAQFWIGTAKPVPPGQKPVPSSPPSRKHFIPARTRDHSPTPKPFGLGLFTSTGVADGRSMWRAYLEGYENSTLFPGPWSTWRLRPDPAAEVYEVGSAADWTRLIEAYPRTDSGFVYPDWVSIAARYAGVHITLRAITAAQGIVLATSHGPARPAYWDVESTFWLRWCFNSTELTSTERDT